MKSICRAAVAQWTTRLTRTGQTRVQNRNAQIFFYCTYKIEYFVLKAEFIILY